MIGDRSFNIKHVPYYVSTSSDMQRVDLEFISSSKILVVDDVDDSDNADDVLINIEDELLGNEEDNKVVDDNEVAFLHEQDNPYFTN